MQAGRMTGTARGYTAIVFLFFSNRVGCLGSLLVSAVVTVILFLIFF